MEAPDVAGEIVAYRAWFVELRWDREALLLSFNATPWPRGDWLRAECTRERCNTPGESCGCGVYAARSRAHLLRMAYNRYGGEDCPVVIGEVGLAGKVIPGDQGWRAEKARVLRIELPHQHWRLLVPLRATYRVPVALSNVLKGA